MNLHLDVVRHLVVWVLLAHAFLGLEAADLVRLDEVVSFPEELDVKVLVVLAEQKLFQMDCYLDVDLEVLLERLEFRKDCYPDADLEVAAVVLKLGLPLAWVQLELGILELLPE